MDVRIGVIHTPKELALESEGSVDDVVATIEDVMKSGAPIVWLDDAKGRKVGVPIDKLAYIELEAEEGPKRVGFGRP